MQSDHRYWCNRGFGRIISLDPRIEILITDINMPNMDGYALAKRPKETRKELRGDRIVWARERWSRAFRLYGSHSY